MEAAVERIEELIAESQTETEEAPSTVLFPLDQREIVRELEVVYDEETKIALYHKLKWPDFDALNKRQRMISTKNEFLGGGKFRSQSDDGVAANAWLWDQYATEVKGYEWDGINPEQWVKVTEALKAEIPSEHKSEAVVELLASEYETERPKGKGYVLGAVTYRIKQTYGPYAIWHVFNKPSEKDRRDISRKSRETQNQPGATRLKTEIFTNLKPFVDLYDKLFVRLEGVTGEDPNVAQRKDLVSAIWKQGVIDELITSFEAPRRDLSKN